MGGADWRGYSHHGAKTMKISQLPLTQTNQTTVQELHKSQQVRLLDIGLFGPLMIMSALNKEPPGVLRMGMFIVGIGTVIYNLNNYLANLPGAKNDNARKIPNGN